MNKNVGLMDFIKELDGKYDIPGWFTSVGDILAARKVAGMMQRKDYGRGVLLYVLARKFGPSRVLDVGTGRGYSTVCMEAGLEASNQTYPVIVTIDKRDSKDEITNTRFDGTVEKTTVNALVAEACFKTGVVFSSKIVLFEKGKSTAALRRQDPGFGLAFIDGGHDENDVFLDACLVGSRMEKDSIMVFHDYGSEKVPGVESGFQDWMDQGYGEGYDWYGVRTHDFIDPVVPDKTKAVCLVGLRGNYAKIKRKCGREA